MHTPIRKALTFRASSIGDCLMGKYLLENIHRQFPEAHLGIVVASRGKMIRDLLAAYPWLEVIEANRQSPRALWRLWREWRGSDLVVTQYTGKIGGKFGLASKLAARVLARRGALVGFSDAAHGSAFLYDRLVPFDHGVAPAEHERRALRAAGLAVPLPYPTLSAVPNKDVLSKFGVSAEKYIVVHLFSGSIKRGLNAASRKKLLSALSIAIPGAPLLVSGGKGDRIEAKEAADGIPTARVIAGDASLQEMISLILQSSRVISLDTGVAHIAAQLRRPLVVMSTCLGLFWWGSDQYGAGFSIKVFNNKAACGVEHKPVEYPPCINTIPYDDSFLHL